MERYVITDKELKDLESLAKKTETYAFLGGFFTGIGTFALVMWIFF